METFGFLPVPEVLMEDALRGVEVRGVFSCKILGGGSGSGVGLLTEHSRAVWLRENVPAFLGKQYNVRLLARTRILFLI